MSSAAPDRSEYRPVLGLDESGLDESGLPETGRSRELAREDILVF